MMFVLCLSNTVACLGFDAALSSPVDREGDYGLVLASLAIALNSRGLADEGLGIVQAKYSFVSKGVLTSGLEAING